MTDKDFEFITDKIGIWFANLKLKSFRHTFDGDTYPSSALVTDYELYIAKLKKDIEFNKNSLPEEPVSEDWEEACEQLAENARKHKAETSSPFFSQTDYKQGVIDGAKWQKEQMMAKAKYGTVQKDNQVILDNGTYIDLYPSMQLKPSFVGLKEGDRIKVIVIKED